MPLQKRIRKPAALPIPCCHLGAPQCALLKPKYALKRLFWSVLAADKEALLIPIVGVAGVDIVLSHLLMEESKVQPVSLFAVSVVTLAIDPSATFDGKFAGMTLQKASNPAVGNLLLRNRAGEILQHLSCRRQAAPCASFYVSHEFLLLLWVEMALRFSRGCICGLFLLVPPRQRRSVNIELFRDFTVREFIS